MKKFCLILLLLVFIINLVHSQKKAQKYFQFPENVSSNDYRHDVILVKVKNDYKKQFQNLKSNKLNISSNTFRKIQPLLKKEIQQRFDARAKPFKSGIDLLYEVTIPSESNIEKVINEAYATGYFEVVEPAYIYKSSFTPNDSRYDEQYYLKSIKADLGWDINQGSEEVVIAIIDEGVDLDHPDLKDRIYYNEDDPVDGLDNDNDGYVDNYAGWDFVGDDHGNPSGDNDPSVNSQKLNHGSTVAGCAAASGNNEIGITGVGFNSRILVTKHAGDNKEAQDASIIGGYAGIIYAANQGADIINCSWGGPFYSQIAQEIINYAVLDMDAVVIAAAGNDNATLPNYPASYEYVISVAALDQDNRRASFSNRGINVDVSAPGTGILTTSFNDSYAFVQGTSFSCPIVAGAAALVKSQFPEYSALQVMEQIRVTADPSIYDESPNLINQMGKGILDVQASLSVKTPAIRLRSTTLSNKQGNVAQAGDTALVVGQFSNYLSPSSGALKATLSAESPYVVVLKKEVNLGRIVKNGSKSNEVDPFEIKILSNTPDNTEISFLVAYEDGPYKDYQYFSVLVNPTYLNVNKNLVSTSIAGNGRIGYQDYGNNEEGIGFGVDGQNILFEMGLMMGNSASKISNAVRSEDSEADNHFKSLIRIQEKSPGEFSLSELTGQFSDENAGEAKSNVSVDYRSMVWQDSPYDKFIIIEYTITNNGSEDLNDYYAGLFADWDISGNGQQDKADYYNDKKLGYVYSSEQQDRIYGGIQLLTGDFNYFAIDNDHEIAGNPLGIYDGFTDEEKFTSLANRLNKTQAGINTENGNDVSHVVSQGPFNIAVEESITVAFAVHGTSGFDNLINSATYADSIYNFTLKANVPVTADKEICYGHNATVIASGAGHYNWYSTFTGGNPVATGQALTVSNLKNDTTFFVSNASNTYESVRAVASVKIKADPTVEVLGNPEICEGDSIILKVAEADEYKWSNDEATQSITVKTEGVFTVTVKDEQLNCRNTSMKPVYTSIQPKPLAEFTIISQSLQKGEPVEFTNQSEQATTYFWEFGDGNTSTEANPSHTYEESQAYTVLLTAIRDNGCSEQAEQTIQIVTGLEDAITRQIKVYPNPAINGLINIELPQSFQRTTFVQIVNNLGKTLYSRAYNKNKIILDLHQISSGKFMILKLQNGGNLVSFKIMQ